MRYSEMQINTVKHVIQGVMSDTPGDVGGEGVYWGIFFDVV